MAQVWSRLLLSQVTVGDQSRWDEGLTLSHTSRTDPRSPDWEFRTKQEQQCPDQVGEGCGSSPLFPWFLEESSASEPKSQDHALAIISG